MQRAMRRKDRLITAAECDRILTDGQYGVLSTVGEQWQPYATPLSYVAVPGAIYFHCTHKGHKLDNISFCPQVCFCVVGKVRAVYDKGFGTFYESVLVYGEARAVDAEKEKTQALSLLLQKYFTEDLMEKGNAYIKAEYAATAVYKIEVSHISGKARPDTSASASKP